MDDPRYPVGRFEAPAEPLAPERRLALIDGIARLPRELSEALAGLDDAQLDTPYRPGGWTARQVAHHVPDSHMNAYIRYGLALTEDEPTIRPYREELWAELPLDKTAPVSLALDLLEPLHERWVALLRAVEPAQWRRRLRHPEHSGILTLDWMLAQYEWHGRHHTGHVRSLRRQRGW
jgi:hypothetical protein